MKIEIILTGVFLCTDLLLGTLARTKMRAPRYLRHASESYQSGREDRKDPFVYSLNPRKFFIYSKRKGETLRLMDEWMDVVL